VKILRDCTEKEVKRRLALLSTKMGIITCSVQIRKGGESLDDYPLEANYVLSSRIITLTLVKGFVCELKRTYELNDIC
jgi:hypothetical protein